MSMRSIFSGISIEPRRGQTCFTTEPRLRRTNSDCAAPKKGLPRISRLHGEPRIPGHDGRLRRRDLLMDTDKDATAVNSTPARDSLDSQCYLSSAMRSQKPYYYPPQHQDSSGDRPSISGRRPPPRKETSAFAFVRNKTSSPLKVRIGHSKMNQSGDHPIHR